MSTNTILASAPLTSTGYHLKANGTTLGNSLIWDNGTNVGIGNTNTTYKLEVTGSTATSQLWQLADNSTEMKIGRYNSSFPNAYIDAIGPSGDVGFQFRTQVGGAGGGTKMTITSAGNVGIGTSSPSYLLDINGMARILRNGGDEALRISNDNGYIGFFNTANSTRSGYIQGNTTSLQISSSLAIPIQFLTSDAEKMRIRADGIISLGAGYAAANSFNYFPIYSAGQPGFNLLSSTSTDLLSFNGNTKALFLGNLTGGATTLSTDASGNIIRTPSDINLKTNIEDLQYGLETIMQLRPIIHNWKESIDTEEKSINMGEGKSIGFIAQEVELLVPEIVCGDEYKSIDYPKMVAILTKAIQELSNRLIKLENK